MELVEREIVCLEATPSKGPSVGRTLLGLFFARLRQSSRALNLNSELPQVSPSPDCHCGQFHIGLG